MQDGYRNLVLGLAFALMVGYVLHVGRGVIVPIVASVLVVYVVLGLARFLEALPGVGPRLPRPVGYMFSILVIGLVLGALISLLITNLNQVIAVAPQYQERLLALIQTGAALVGIEEEPTWETVTSEVLGQINIQSLIASTAISVSSIVAVFALVLIYSGFLLAEQGAIAKKIERLSPDPMRVARIRAIIADINARIGTYLALKTFINIVLGLISYAIMAALGIEFAGFWATLIAALNYIPYLGSFLGVAFPVALSLLQFEALSTTIVVLVALTAAQTFVGNFLEPTLMGSSLNLSPFVILVSLMIWSSIWGIAGALLAVPITAIMVIILSEFDGTRPLAVLLSRDGNLPAPPPAAERAPGR
jgi:predicted PurR-regulated permease PerM